jgi:Ca2+-binding RTX toxin-like protein
MVRNSSNVVVSNSQFQNLGNGLSHLDSDHITFSGNTFRNIRIDGIHGGGSSNVTIANNFFTDFHRHSGDHPDAIQFWTTNTTTSAHDIVVADNLIVRGDGTSMQGIFIGDESRGKLPYVNLTVTGNTVIGSMYHGISISDVRNADVSHNTVVGYEDMRAWIRVDGADGLTLADNVTSHISLTKENVNVTNVGNTIVPLTSAETNGAYLHGFDLAHQVIIDPSSLTSLSSGLTKAGAATVVSDAASANQLVGTSEADVIEGQAGADTLSGGAGDDVLRGADGNDRMDGGAGFDDMNGNMGSDTVSGGGGADWVVGGKDNDLLFGEDDGDIVYGNLGSDTCDGGAGNDLVRGGQQDDVLTGGLGDDWLSGDKGADTITGGAGADIFHTFADNGVDRVTDFNATEGDRVQLDPGAHYSLHQVGADTVIDMGGGNEMVLVGVNLSSLPNGWIFGA